MKKTLKTFMAIPVVLALLLSGCSLDDPDSPTGLKTPAGTQVFKNYVSLGNSLTAGYMDSGLMVDGQYDSYPRLISRAIGIADENFTQPLVSFPGIGSTDVGNPALIAGVLHFDGMGISPVDVTNATEVMGLLLAVNQPAPYHNLGVPGAWTVDMLSAYTAATSVGQVPFFDFINRAGLYSNSESTVWIYEPDGVTPKELTYQTASTGWQAITKGPTLVTLWIGNNDILYGATGGNPSAMNMTHPNEFGAMYSDLLQLLAGGLIERTGFPATIMVANIPDITDTAYFIDQATFDAATGIAGGWPGGTEDADVALYCFPVLSWASPGNAGNPVPSNYTLTTAEAGLVAQYVGGYNLALGQLVAGINATGLATVGLADMNSALADLDQAQKTHFMLLLPQMMGDVEMAAATTMFSLDGVHPNNKGYGLTANVFIDAINDLVGTDAAPVDLGTLTWDPTYGETIPVPGKTAGMPRLSPEAAHAMTAIWQR